jgi:hypothetical protein
MSASVPANRVTELVAENRSITADTALRLAAALGTTAESWMNLQKSFELRTAEREAGRVGRAKRIHGGSPPGKGGCLSGGGRNRRRRRLSRGLGKGGPKRDVSRGRQGACSSGSRRGTLTTQGVEDACDGVRIGDDGEDLERTAATRARPNVHVD